jgi:hypothetical protein
VGQIFGEISLDVWETHAKFQLISNHIGMSMVVSIVFYFNFNQCYHRNKILNAQRQD